MKWIIQEDVFDENYLEDMEEALRDLGLAQGRGYEIIQYVPFADATYLPIVPDNKAIVYGSINLLKQVQRYTKWSPGATITWDNYNITNYLLAFGDNLLNRYGHFTLLSSLVSRASELIKESKFIRPNAGDKGWVGGLYTLDEFRHESEFVLQNSGDQLMYVCFPKNIQKEWRIFCIEDRVITGSQYRSEGIKDVDGFVPREVVAFAEHILSSIPYRPDPVFALDICYTDEKFHIVELSSFNCAGLYACDIQKLITEVHRYYT